MSVASTRRALGAFTFVALCLGPWGPRANAEASVDRALESATAALERGDADGAIRALEALADRGTIHPDLSFDRGLAYWMRARSERGLPGDRGRAVAGFEEAALLRPDDVEAREQAEFVRAEIRARRHRASKDDPIVRPTLERAALGLASPLTWSALALVASLVVAAGIALRSSSTARHEVVSSILLSLGGAALLVLAPLAFGSSWLETNTRVGVVVVPEVALRDATGGPVDAPVLPEGSVVEVGGRHQDLVELRWGPHEGRVPWSSVRVLARPPDSAEP